MTLSSKVSIPQFTRVGFSNHPDTETAAREVLESLRANESALTLLFYGPNHDPEVAARLLKQYAGDRGVGGSTAGELGDGSFQHGTIVGISISAEIARSAVRAVGNVDATSLLPFRSLGADLAQRLDLELDDLDPARHMWVGLFDGLVAREEMVVPFFARHSSAVPLVGGSLGDEERMEAVTLIHDGQVHRSAAAIVLLEYNRPFRLFHQTHSRLTDQRFEVTGVRQGGRVITTLGDRPAALVYAEALGVSLQEVDVAMTGSHPLGYRFRGRPFPCSVMRVESNDALLMAYGVQKGEFLNLLEPGDIVQTTRDALAEELAEFESEHGVAAQSMLAFHCLGRYREARLRGVLPELYAALNQLPLIGLNTYGEQFGGLHMNHSLTAILFG